MGFSLRGLLKGVGSDLNIFDHGKSQGNPQGKPQPASTARPNIAQKVFNQINPLDNGRTFQQTTPTNNRSVVGQATHNAVTNTIGKFYSPVTDTVSGLIVEPLRSATAQIKGNTAAMNAAEQRKYEDIGQSAPGFVANNAVNFSKAAYNLPTGIKADVHGFQGKAPTASEQSALSSGLSGLNQTTVGQVVSPAESAINSFIPGAKEQSAAAGYDVNAPGFKKYVLNPAFGTVGTAALAAGAQAPTEAAFDATVGQAKSLASNVRNVTTKLVPLTEEGSVRLPFTQGDPGANLLNVSNPLGAKTKPLPVNNPLGAKVDKQLQVKSNVPVKPTTQLTGAAQQSFLGKLTAPFKDEIGAVGPGVGELRDETSGLIPSEKPNFATLDDAFKEIQRPKAGKQGVVLSHPEIQQINDLFVNHPDPINQQFRGKVYGKFNNARDVILGHANGNTVVSELDKNGVPTGRVRAHATPLNPDDIVGDFGNVGINDRTVGQKRYIIPSDDSVGTPQSRPRPSSGLPIVGDPLEQGIPNKTVPTDNRVASPQDLLGSVSSANITPKSAEKSSRFAKGVASSQEISPELQAQVKGKGTSYTPVASKEQLANSEKLVGKGVDNAATDVAERLHVKAGKINDQTVSDTIATIKALDARGKTADLQRATDLTEQLSGHLTKAGQTVQAASLLSNRTPEGLLYGARKVLKKAGVEVTPEIQKTLQTQIEKIKSATDTESKGYATAELAQQVNKLIPSSFSDKAVSLWKAGLLTGIKTQTGNAVSNLASIGLKTASNPLAAGIDKLISLKTGERTKTFTLKGDLSGGIEGVKAGVKSLKTGIDERNLEHVKFDTKQVNFGKSLPGRAAQKYVDSVFGLMGAADRPYYYSQLRNNLQDIAKADAINHGLKGAEAAAHIDEFIKNPPTEAFQTATNAAEKSIFGNDTLLSKGAAGIRNSVEGHPLASAAVNVLMPFTKVPSAVITRLFDYTPVGAVKTVVSQIAKGKLDQRALAEGLAEAATGTGALAIGYALHQSGNMTGAYPTDPKEQELWKLEGKQANAIKIGGKWQSINYTSPLGQVLATGGQISQAYQDGQRGAGLIGTTAAGAGKSVIDQSFLQGVQGGLDAVNDPQRNAAKFIKSQASSVIPTLVDDTAKATDPLQRQSNSVGDAVKAKIPGVSQTLLPKQTAFGDNLKRQSNALNTLVNPLRPSDIPNTNPLNGELRRLQDAGFGVMPSTNNKTITSGDKKIQLTPQQLFDKNSKTGKQVQDAWNKIISNPAYDGLSDSEKQKALSNSLSDINAFGTKSFAAENNVGEYDPSYTGKQSKTSKKQAAIASGSLDPSSYLTSSTKTDKQKQSDTSFTNKSSDVSLALSRAKTKGDVNTWLNTAAQQYDAIENYKKTLDPTKDHVKINSLSKQQDSLVTEAQKYQSQGGFTKPKKAKKTGTTKSKVSGFGAPKITSGVASSTALRNLVKNVHITRKKVTK